VKNTPGQGVVLSPLKLSLEPLLAPVPFPPPIVCPMFQGDVTKAKLDSHAQRSEEMEKRALSTSLFSCSLAHNCSNGQSTYEAPSQAPSCALAKPSSTRFCDSCCVSASPGSPRSAYACHPSCMQAIQAEFLSSACPSRPLQRPQEAAASPTGHRLRSGDSSFRSLGEVPEKTYTVNSQL
jgi:hypothetical protein